MRHHHSQISRKTRLRAVIAISFCFFVAEISISFYTLSIALVADAFHYLNDLIGFIVALVAVQLLGAFFNGAFLVALGLSILLQSIERFISLQHVEDPKLVLIVGCIWLALNLVSAAFLHEHDHGDRHRHSHRHIHGHSSHTHNDVESISTHERHVDHLHLDIKASEHGMDLGILGVLIHILGDAINNIGVIVSALIIWFTQSPSRFYADPAVAPWIALMVLISALPLTKRSGEILLQSAPLGVKVDDIKHDLESIPGILSVHELHVWRLDQCKAIATVHVAVKDPEMESFMRTAKVITECLHAYGIHSVTLQPELQKWRVADDEIMEVGLEVMTMRTSLSEKCGLPCGSVCEELKCCK